MPAFLQGSVATEPPVVL